MILRIAAALGLPDATELLTGVVQPLDALRGQREVPGPALLLSEEEVVFVREYRQLPAEDRAHQRTTVSALVAWRRRRGARSAPRTTR